MFYIRAVKSELPGCSLWSRTPRAHGCSPGPSAELHQLQGLAGSQQTRGTAMSGKVPRSLLCFYSGETTIDSWEKFDFLKKKSTCGSFGGHSAATWDQQPLPGGPGWR